MAKLSPRYSIGDMVAHRNYGIGQIDCIENKPINGVQVDCFRVKTDNSVYWFPTDSKDNPRIHPLATKVLIQRVIEILQSAPHGLENDPIQWKERIDDVWASGDILSISRLIRDLTALKTNKKLIRIQDQALKNLKDCLLREWAASLQVDAKSIQPKLRAYLKISSANFQSAA